MSGIFISYSRKDEAFARRLATSLEEMGSEVWIDVDDIPSGQKWSTAIQQGLDSAEIMLVILSPDSMASVNVEDEWQYFIDHKKPVIPILLREAKIHFQLNRIQWVDFLNQPYERALNDLHQELSQKGADIRRPADVTAVSYSRSDVQRYAESVAEEVKVEKPAQAKSSSLPMQLIVGVGIGALAAIAVMFVVLSSGNDNPNLEVEASETVVAENVQATATGEPTATDEPTNAPTATDEPTATIAPTNTPTEVPFVLEVVLSNLDWDVIERNINGVDMVLVPPGTFTLGATDAQLRTNRSACELVLNDCSGLNDEQPLATITIEQGFWIDKTEVTNETYNGTGDDLPKVNVNAQEAAAHCSGRDARLPTEVEWEYAASGPDDWNYPWGNTWDTSVNRANVCDSNCAENWRDNRVDDGYAGLAPVGSYPDGASWVGALDMAGNVWEYTSSIYAPYPYDAGDAEGGSASAARTLRGSAYIWITGEATTSARAAGIAPQTDFYGFRCARDYVDGDLERYE